MGRVQDRVVIVTGGAGGIGAAACHAIAAEGGKVVVADLDAAAARAVADAIVADGGTADVGRRRRHRSPAGAGDDPEGGRHVRRAQRDLQQRRDEPAARLHGGRRGELRADRPRQHLGRDRLHPGGREADDRAGLRRQDRQHRVDREPAGILGLRPLLRREVRHRSPSRRRPRAASSSTGSPSTRSRRASSTRRCGSASTRTSGRSTTQPDEADPMREFATGTLIGRPAAPASWRRSSSTSPRPSPTT